jgi:hypothetical protein
LRDDFLRLHHHIYALGTIFLYYVFCCDGRFVPTSWAGRLEMASSTVVIMVVGKRKD